MKNHVLVLGFGVASTAYVSVLDFNKIKQRVLTFLGILIKQQDYFSRFIVIGLLNEDINNDNILKVRRIIKYFIT